VCRTALFVGYQLPLSSGWAIKQITNSVALVCERTIPTWRPPLVDEVSATFLRIEGCRLVSAAHPYVRNVDFLDRIRYFFFQVAPQLYSTRLSGPAGDGLYRRKC
jgi:hypothetical protein